MAIVLPKGQPCNKNITLPFAIALFYKSKILVQDKYYFFKKKKILSFIWHFPYVWDLNWNKIGILLVNHVGHQDSNEKEGLSNVICLQLLNFQFTRKQFNLKKKKRKLRVSFQTLRFFFFLDATLQPFLFKNKM